MSLVLFYGLVLVRERTGCDQRGDLPKETVRVGQELCTGYKIESYRTRRM
jgi:hypothetical protein